MILITVKRWKYISKKEPEHAVSNISMPYDVLSVRKQIALEIHMYSIDSMPESKIDFLS